MICPVCADKVIKSRVFPGYATTTCIASQSFYDEEGHYHSHDINSTSQVFNCSQGHSWVSSTGNRCWCGWSGQSEAIRILSSKGKE